MTYQISVFAWCSCLIRNLLCSVHLFYSHNIFFTTESLTWFVWLFISKWEFVRVSCAVRAACRARRAVGWRQGGDSQRAMIAQVSWAYIITGNGTRETFHWRRAITVSSGSLSLFAFLTFNCLWTFQDTFNNIWLKLGQLIIPVLFGTYNVKMFWWIS